MKKLLHTFALFLLFVLSTQAQVATAEWAIRAGGDNIDYGQSITTDSSGNVYVTGDFASDSIAFGTTTLINDSAGYPDMYVVKYDASGNVLWAKSAGGSDYDRGYDISTDVSGNVYVVGYFQSSSITFGSITLTNAGYKNMYVVKYDAFGNVMWAKSAGGNGDDSSLGISTDASSNVYVTGNFSSPTITFGSYTLTNNNAGYADMYVVKYDANGNVLWAKRVGGSNYDTGSDICIDVSGNVYLTGHFGSSSITFGSITLTNTNLGSEDMFVVKYDASGNVLWAKSAGGMNSDYGIGISTDISGNVYVTGGFQSPSITFGSTTFTNAGICDMYVVKYDGSGNVLWAKSTSSATSTDAGHSISTDVLGNVYVTGYFQSSSITFGSITLTNAHSGWEEMYVVKYTTEGGVLWARSAGGSVHDSGNGISADAFGNVYVTGGFNSPTLTFGAVTLTKSGANNMFVVKYNQPRIYGTAFNDINENCVKDNEPGLTNCLAVINPGNIVVETNEEGFWGIDSLPAGNYTITYNIPVNWQSNCSSTQYFTVVNSNEIIHAPDFGMVSTQPCAGPDVSIIMPFMRPCFTSQKIYVNANNKYTATGALNAAFVIVELDSLITPTSSSLAYTNVGSNLYRFNLGTLNPGQHVNFTINANVSCSAMVGKTLCMEARLFPADSCMFDTIPSMSLPSVTPCTLPWDNSSLQVNGWCANDSVHFTVTNHGSGNMQCYAPIRVYVNDTLLYIDSVLLASGQSITYSYMGNGRTWVLQADQHPLHPGNSHPNAHVEACGILTNWIPGLVNNLPLDDADPIIDIYCGVVRASYDPNDKTGFPMGLGTPHDILPNQQLQYMIRFQNTGTDTAFTVLVRDTLDVDLDIFSVTAGVASHSYTFRMYGPRVLEWRFDNILLPDSTTNEPGSHGFLTFTVNQKKNLPNGTTILNEADIYFDFNAPVITNTTLHTINTMENSIPLNLKSDTKNQTSIIKTYPNPNTGHFKLEMGEMTDSTEVIITNVVGQKVGHYSLNNTSQADLFINGESGVYFLKITSGNKIANVKVVKM